MQAALTSQIETGGRSAIGHAEAAQVLDDAELMPVPWARIDDGFDDHPKVLALLEHEDGPAAIGLWTLCLTWAHRNTRKKGKVPGRVPDSLPRRYLGTPGRGAAKLLAEVGLWDEADGGGWDIHDFDKYLPTTETSEARSAAGKKGAQSRWGKRADGNLPSGAMANDGNGMAADGDDMPPYPSEDVAAPEGGSSHSGDSKLPFGDSNEPFSDGKRMATDGSRAPARRAIPKGIAPEPEPEPEPDSNSLSAPAARDRKLGTRLPDDFEEQIRARLDLADWFRRNCQHVDGKRELEQFCDYWRAQPGKDGRKADWVATWRRWMRTAEDRTKPRGGYGNSNGGYRPSTTDQRVAQAQAVKAQLAAIEQAGGSYDAL